MLRPGHILFYNNIRFKNVEAERSTDIRKKYHTLKPKRNYSQEYSQPKISREIRLFNVGRIHDILLTKPYSPTISLLSVKISVNIVQRLLKHGINRYHVDVVIVLLALSELTTS